ncbi:MAG TPA: hypothetical protein EYO96_00335, partial [Candidatus Marinimicrobia bacterium]|nr:hypothetical protein [Candidatus Neomarinimicrobiota bacterium]
MAIGIMITYTATIYLWDVVFDQNIMDLIEPTLDIERAFGPWPIYIFVNIFIAIVWYGIIYISA